jgi:hypothetical protein
LIPIGPPGCGYDEVNRLMNRAKFGVVCGRDDGAPPILTEYMLAGLPVLCLRISEKVEPVRAKQ